MEAVDILERPGHSVDTQSPKEPETSEVMREDEVLVRKQKTDKAVEENEPSSREAETPQITREDKQSTEKPIVADAEIKAANPLSTKPGKKGLTRRLLFQGAVALGTLAAVGGGMLALVTSKARIASKDSAGSTQATLSTPPAVATPPAISTPSAVSNAPQVQTVAGGQLREYWIQADAFYHNLVPTGLDGMSGTRYNANQTSYWALGYRAYTPGWGTPLPGDENIGANTGIPGPTLRAEVGDTIRVHFRNNDTYYRFCHSMHPHGLLYTPANDGSWAALFATKPGTALNVGETFTYEWKAIASSVGSWPYHDHSMAATIAGSSSSSGSEMNPSSGIMELGAELGLFGMIAVTDAQTPRIDREIILCFQDLYEADIPQLFQDFDCFNGYAFLGNTPTFEARVGERVRWRIMALGKDFHVFHLHGHRWFFNGRYDDSLAFGPATTLTFDYVEDNPGTWLYHCHVTDHMMGGMVGFYIAK
jgi:FtsP/CotA-like multicopper oxidase with cupredoxin domain